MFRFLFDDNAPGGGALLFQNPHAIVTATSLSGIEPAIDALEQANADGLYAAGFLSFELGYALEPKLRHFLPDCRDVPLLLFGLFGEPSKLNAGEFQGWLLEHGGDYSIGNISQNISKERYLERFDRVQSYISSGDIYQLNLTFKTRFEFSGSPLGLFGALRIRQPVHYGAFMEAPGLTLLSLSPELFIERKGSRLRVKPMKGTAPRALSAYADEETRARLSSDPKSRAENLMIVDLMRNDLARIAVPGSVEVTRLFEVETYRTLHQMTSTVEAELPKAGGIREMLHALFPAGSVTGAPKVRAMEIIKELENEPRGVYTGAMGYLAPDRSARLNVAIRTIKIGASGRAEIGIGSGIVADSEAEAEYGECLLKLCFLSDQPTPDFDLIETLLFESGRGYVLLDRHLERLSASAAYFAFELEPGAAEDALNRHAAGLSGGTHRVRLTASKMGRLTVSSTPLPASTAPAKFRFVIAEERMRTDNVFLYHKTTERAFYDKAREAYKTKTGSDEVVFLNERGELTEGSFTTLFARIDGVLLTPALSCGLLPGTLRAELLARGEIEEAVLKLPDLKRATGIWLGNSVRGLVEAERI